MILISDLVLQNSGLKTEDYRMPAEWEPHESIWLSWPKNLQTFPEKILPKVEGVFVEIIRQIHASERVDLLVDDLAMEDRVRNLLDQNGITSQKNIKFHKIKSADVWIRDYGPTFIKGQKTHQVKAIKWKYNAYGDKYDDLAYDDKTGQEIAMASGKEFEKVDLVFEGGSFDVNGKGSMITTEQCLLNKNRNSKMAKPQIEAALKHHLGVSNIIWLKEGVVGDDTDGHIDDIARFVGEKKIVCAVEENKNDENFVALQKNFQLLESARDQDGEEFAVAKLPMPRAIFADGLRLPASYANFYIGNKVVLLPTFKDPNDQEAIETLSECFRNRKIAPIYCEPLVWGLGTIHCSSQQQPV